MAHSTHPNTILSPTFSGINVDIVVQDVNDNGQIVLAAAPNVADPGWALVGNEIQFTGSPQIINVTMTIENVWTAGQRPSPAVYLEKANGVGAFADVDVSATGYIRNNSDHQLSSNKIYYPDRSPGVNPRYRLRSFQESTVGNPVNSTNINYFDAEARI